MPDSAYRNELSPDHSGSYYMNGNTTSAGGLSTITEAPNSFTVEFWAKPTATHQVDAEGALYGGISGQRYLIAPTWLAGSTEAGMGVSMGTNGVSVYEHAAGYMPALLVWQSPTLITDWVHVAIVYANGKPTLYINGVQVRTGLQSSRQLVYPSFNFTGYDYGSYQGYVDEMRIWSEVRTQQQIADNRYGPIPSPQTNLSGYWPVDAANPGVLLDLSGNGRDVTMMSTTGNSSDHVMGGNGYRYGFNGKENDNEVKGEGNQIAFEARIYDPRLGRFYSVDPVTNKYPDMTPYNFAANSPIWLVDRKGKEPDRNQAGTIDQAAGQWAQLKNQSAEGILNYIQTDPNAVRYIYTKDKGWIDLQHYFGTIKYGKTSMDLLEPASGNKLLQDKLFGAGANESYYSYEDLPSNQFASEAKNLSIVKEKVGLSDDGIWVKDYVVEQKTGKDLINSVKENFINANATNPEAAPNWKGIPFKDHGERKRLPEIKGYTKSWISVGMAGAGMAVETTTPINYTDAEKKELLNSGKYIPQNHTSQPYNLTNFPSAPSSLQNGDQQKSATGHN